LQRGSTETTTEGSDSGLNSTLATESVPAN
jgi:hypothetical protein